MAAHIEFTDTRVDYVSIADARKMSGLRLVLGAYAVPGPWREACKGLFHVKGVPFTSVVTSDTEGADLKFGAGGADRELVEWTGQASAPVAVWNDERPRSTWPDQINLAERLAPEPALVPSGIDERILMFGLINELAGEHGLGWTKRITIVENNLKALPPGAEGREFFEHMAQKYPYSEAQAAAAPARMATIIATLGRQYRNQREHGSRFFIGETLSALDIYFSTFIAMFAPLPQDVCPMASAFLDFYNNPDPETQAVLTEDLLAHRDFIYREYLEFPVVF